jgi:hypothetical protein
MIRMRRLSDRFAKMRAQQAMDETQVLTGANTVVQTSIQADDEYPEPD